jgi:hypothetical protein
MSSGSRVGSRVGSSVGSSRVLTVVLLTVLVGALCGVGVACVVVLLEPSSEPSGPAAVRTPAAVRPPAPDRPGGEAPAADTPREVLRAWDAARERAWTSGDPSALRRLYTARSVAGRRDVAMLEAWSARGLRLTALSTQVLRLQVVVERERRLVLVLTDRVARAEADGVPLPADRSSTRRLVLLRADGAEAPWRVAAVSPAPPARS